ncbi:b68 [miniopterid betaherpesvirus 1]|uniref:B68 n=1 Tax=miniopterid betaherpesvirus 1 TaxID=3070189 RepID=I3VQ56_9BETA|nr:b68 [miniopterid betaherpesvirus 1]AFK83900.1 b68 [miniopterid betaherpesvirus 1]
MSLDFTTFRVTLISVFFFTFTEHIDANNYKEKKTGKTDHRSSPSCRHRRTPSRRAAAGFFRTNPSHLSQKGRVTRVQASQRKSKYVHDWETRPTPSPTQFQ